MRLKGYDYATPAAYFVTIVIRHRACRLGKVADGRMFLNTAGRMVLASWEELRARFSNVQTDTAIVMPNHLHGIVMINAPTPSPTAETGRPPASPTAAIGRPPLMPSVTPGQARVAPTPLAPYDPPGSS